MVEEQISFFGEENNKEEIKELKRLTKFVSHYNKKYYEEDISEITDFEYDKLSLRLRALEAKYPEFKKNSPTSKIGGKNKEIFNKVFHEVQMQSLQDVFSFDAVREFVEKVQKEYGDDTEFVVETKIDGLSVSLEYENGKLVRGSTRGDGNVGEDVTENLRVVNGIPEELKRKDTIEVRGEVYLPREEFNNINDVERFRKCDLMVTRDNALPLKEGQYYLCDVPGAVVINEDTEEEIGKVTDVMETGANNVFVIETKEGKEVLFPVIPDCIKKVDTKEGIVRAHVMKGLIE